MKRNYTNVIVIGCVLIAAVVFLIMKTVRVEAVLLQAGYYDKKISILNTADVFGHLVYNNINGEFFSLDETHLQMGMPLMKAIADGVRKQNPDTLLFDTGDMFAGTNEANVNQGEGMVRAANLMGYSAGALGQHDFNWGFARAEKIKNELNYPLLAANIYKDGKPAFESYKIFEVGGKKIGVFGITSDQFLQDLKVTGDKGITYEDPIPIAKSIVEKLKAEHVDAIVALSHIGDDYDKATLIPQVPGIDLVLSGRGYVLYKKAEKVNQTYVAEAGAYGAHVGVADLYFKDGKVSKVSWRVQQTNDRSREDKAVAEVAEKYFNLAMEEGKKVIGSTTVDLDGIRTHVRTKETNLANLIADAMRQQGNADIAIFNGGQIRESIPKGDITLYNVNKPLPYVNSTMTVEVKGELIYKAIEHGLETWPNGAHNGGFLQVSGISFVIDGSKPAGKRLAELTRDGQPLDKEKLYKVALPDYLVEGGDGYDIFAGVKVLSRGELLKDVLAKHIEASGAVAPAVEGRIKVINQRYN